MSSARDRLVVRIGVALVTFVGTIQIWTLHDLSMTDRILAQIFLTAVFVYVELRPDPVHTRAQPH